MTDHPENYDEYYHCTDAQRWRLAEMEVLDDLMDDQQRGLERLADEDYLGLCFFGDRDDWVDSRLSRKPPK
ncbi:hypothetical protein A9W99_14500 [Mycobacterium sp. 1164966.3]|uniref:hypothetical protein n=1 Tax=Mycobacterium sp. 1164966.3 TaxID=1856861 RepID=UPI0008015DF3|nr:hypothetical protein [Mycobacterium sp. 1164966.3]OBA81243.1 hypothetical protein A9W99_14500 [Mycobacterium sp. 1164966.3]